MHVLITGAGGMLGRRLAGVLLDKGLGGVAVTRLTLADVVEPGLAGRAAHEVAVTEVAADIAAPGVAARLLAGRPDVVYHLAAIVSGEAELDLEKGYRINLDGTRALCEAVRLAGNAPRLVFASSVAVFGGPFPERIPDTFLAAPRTSYGTQKAMGELLVEDYSRRGFMDGVSLRLPTICIRPGAPNKAASGFFSNILREPLAGLPAVLPAPDTVRHWFASPFMAVQNLHLAGSVDLSPLGHRRSVNLPGLSATVAEQIEALRAVAGAAAVALIRREPDALITGIVSNWAQDFEPERALAMGFRADASFEEIIRRHIAEIGA